MPKPVRTSLVHALALCGLLLGAAGCTETSAPPPPAAEAPDYSCAQDSDCTVSCVIANDCCGELCECSNAYHVDELRQVQAANNKACTDKDSDGCPVASCSQPTFHNVAACEANRCVTKRVPNGEAPTDSPTGAPAVMKVKVPMFGEVSIADGDVLLMDGGTHDVQGHRLRVPAIGPATWQRSVGSMRPQGKEGMGQLQLTGEEATQLRTSVDALWELAASGTAAFNQPIDQGPPRWVWAIVVRRGDIVRKVHGGGLSSPSGAPKAAIPVLKLLARRIDEVAQESP